MYLPFRYYPLESTPSRSTPTGFAIPALGQEYKFNFRSLLIRLMSGNLDFRCELTGKIFKPRVNYFVLGDNIPLTPDINLVHSRILTSKRKLYKYASTPDPKNRKFYGELFMEICRYIHVYSEEKHIESFLHAYRILEKISMVLPLIWASKTNDYSGSFKDLKLYFNDEKSGELRTLERFVNGFIDAGALSANCDFQFYSSNGDFQEKNYNLFKKICIAVNAEIKSETPYSSISIPYAKVNSVCISFRNRYFHLLTGDPTNIGFQDCPDPESMFNSIHPLFFQWLMFNLAEIIKYDIDRS